MPCVRMSLLVAAVVLTAAPFPHAAEPKTLLQSFSEWQYPDSTFNGASTTDGETIGPDGNRTVPSSINKSVMTTPDPVEKVLAYYREKLKAPPKEEKADDENKPDLGRSVSFQNFSEGRPFALHLILVNTSTTSTTLTITRGPDEKQTHIAWTQYVRHDLPKPAPEHAAQATASLTDPFRLDKTRQVVFVDTRVSPPARRRFDIGQGSISLETLKVENNQLTFRYTPEVEGGYTTTECTIPVSATPVEIKIAPDGTPSDTSFDLTDCTPLRHGNLHFE